MQLRDVQCVEDSARRVAWTDDAGADRQLPESVNAIGMTPGEGGLHYRLRQRFTDVAAEYVADWVAVVGYEDELEFDEAVLREYGERVAFFTLFPFVRSTIYGAASRLNQPVPVLGFVRQGELDGGEDLTAEEAHAAFDLESGSSGAVRLD